MEWTGRYELWMTFTWTEQETSPCHYVVERHRISSNTWEQQGIAQKGDGFLKVWVGHQGPNDGWQYHQTMDKIRVTCVTDPDDGDPASVEYTFVFPTSRSKQMLVNRSINVTNRTNNSVSFNVKGDDDSKYLYCANLHVYNRSQGDRLIYERGLGLGNPALAINYCDHHKPVIGFTVTGNDVPREGDVLQVHYIGICGNSHAPQDLQAARDGTEAIFGATYSSPVNFPLLTLSATQGNNFAYHIGNAPGITGNPFAATYSKTTGTMPPGMSLASDGWLTGTPTSTGTFNFHVQTVSEMGDIGGGDVRVIVGVSQLPVINNPGPQVLNQYVPYSLQLTASHNPSSWAVTSGTLPTGLSLNTSTGEITGTPTAIQSPTSVGFKATNVTGQGPEMSCNFSVVALGLPVITSPSTASAYRGEAWNYTVTASNSPISFSAAPLPKNTVIDSQSGRISGTIDPAQELPGTRSITLRATNYTGQSAPFILTLTILDRLPVITSDLNVTGICFQQFMYIITATGYPTSFGADNLPFGLSVDPETGIISGVVISPGTFTVNLSATNSAGTGTAVLTLIFKLLRPVIDTSITAGKAITCETGIPVVFQPVASNNPTLWQASPVQDGFTIDGNLPIGDQKTATGPNGQLKGTFTTVGLYGLVYIASNIAGPSDPAIFYFLVELGSGGSAEASLGDGLDIWIDLQDGAVSIMPPGSKMEQTITQTENGTTTETKKEVAEPTEKAVLWSKRGDTLPLTIRFHKGGKPVRIENMSSLKFGVREDFTLPYAVLTTGFATNEDGSYRIWPNYSDNKEIDFEIDDEEEFLELLAEVQWETGTLDPEDTNPFTRRSSQTFTNRIYRDVIYPDDSAQPESA